MARGVLNGNLRRYNDDKSEFELDAKNVRQLFAQLGARYLALIPHPQEGIAVAIDGEIYQDALLPISVPMAKCTSSRKLPEDSSP